MYDNFHILLQIPESTWAVDQALQGPRRLPCREKVMQSISMFYTKSDDAAELRIYPVCLKDRMNYQRFMAQ